MAMQFASSSTPSPTEGSNLEMSEKLPPQVAANEYVSKETAIGDRPAESDSASDETDALMAVTKSTREDQFNMHRMGKKQELIRHFRLISTICFVGVATAAWELSIFLITPGLVDGGLAGLIYSMIWSFIGFGPIYLSMAEMAGMAPISGAQYHWVSEFAPDSCQKLLSYVTGWTSTVAWQAGNAVAALFTGTLIQSLIQISNPDYAYPNWQGTLLVIAILVATYTFNVYGNRILPHWQNAVFAIHVLGFFGFLVPIWINAPKNSARTVFTEFSNTGGWSSMTLAVFVGQLSGISSQVAIDTAAHMSEDVRNAGRSVPIVMMSVYILNFIMIITAVITICFAITDLNGENGALNDISGYPVVWVLQQSMSTGWVLAVLSIVTILLFCSGLSYMAAVIRDLFAFARDSGLPGSKWIAVIHSRRHIPENGARLTTVVGTLLSLIYIGSPTAVYAVTSLSTVALLQCYFTSIGSLLWRRIYYPETLPPSQFALGRWGIPVNIAAVLFCVWGFFWCFWPQTVNPSAEDLNWAGPIYGAVLLFAIVYYAVYARKTYIAPVSLVLGRGRPGHVPATIYG